MLVKSIVMQLYVVDLKGTLDHRNARKQNHIVNYKGLNVMPLPSVIRDRCVMSCAIRASRHSPHKKRIACDEQPGLALFFFVRDSRNPTWATCILYRFENEEATLRNV